MTGGYTQVTGGIPSDVLLAMVAVPSVVAELWFTVWLLTSARRLPEQLIVESVLEPS